MDICKGEKSQGTLGTEGTRVHQGTDGNQQWTKVPNIVVQVLFQDVSTTFFSGHYKLHT